MKRNHPATNHTLSLSRSGITGYLAGAAGFTAVLAAPQADAAVTAVTFGFGTEYTASDGADLSWTVGPGFGTLLGFASSHYLVLGNGVQNSPYKTAYNWRRAAIAGSW